LEYYPPWEKTSPPISSPKGKDFTPCPGDYPRVGKSFILLGDHCSFFFRTLTSEESIKVLLLRTLCTDSMVSRDTVLAAIRETVLAAFRDTAPVFLRDTTPVSFQDTAPVFFRDTARVFFRDTVPVMFREGIRSAWFPKKVTLILNVCIGAWLLAPVSNLDGGMVCHSRRELRP
jgi:hypothetical protein